MKNFKLLGNCQVCGRLQAVNSGMSKHGYTVAQGWFQGVCSGEGELPMQQDDTVTKRVYESIKAEIVQLEITILNLKSGQITPKTAPTAGYYKAPRVPFAEAPEYYQQEEVDSVVRNIQYRIKAGLDHANYITALSVNVMGKELIKEIKPVKAPMILEGEKRLADDGVFVCRYVDGARVYWKKVVGEKTYKSWTGTTAWRKLELVK